MVGLTAEQSSVNVYRGQLNSLVNFCRENKVKRISSTTIKDWTANRLASGMGTYRMIQMRKLVSRYYKWAIQNRYVKENPIKPDMLQKLTKSKAIRVYFSEEQYRKALDVCRKNPRDFWYGAMMVAWNTGLRLSDVAMLKWESLNVETETLRIKIWKLRKQNVEVEIPVDPDLFDFLSDIRTHPKYPGHPFVFPDMNQYYAGVRTLMTGQFRKICDEAGLPDHTFHSLRHSFISRMLNAGVDSQIVANITGLCIAQLATYAHISLDAKRNAMIRMRENLRAA